MKLFIVFVVACAAAAAELNKLTPQEKSALEKSAGAVKELVSVIGV